ncbi:hypothetical protein PM082_024281 [Marasmius tenuissimus]|nr:hypothetical protein PM082_024281 [Marasmius tenuissimus]
MIHEANEMSTYDGFGHVISCSPSPAPKTNPDRNSHSSVEFSNVLASGIRSERGDPRRGFNTNLDESVVVRLKLLDVSLDQPVGTKQDWYRQKSSTRCTSTLSQRLGPQAQGRQENFDHHRLQNPTRVHPEIPPTGLNLSSRYLVQYNSTTTHRYVEAGRRA